MADQFLGSEYGKGVSKMVHDDPALNLELERYSKLVQLLDYEARGVALVREHTLRRRREEEIKISSQVCRDVWESNKRKILKSVEEIEKTYAGTTVQQDDVAYKEGEVPNKQKILKSVADDERNYYDVIAQRNAVAYKEGAIRTPKSIIDFGVR